MKKDDLLEKQVSYISSELEKRIREVTEKCIEEDGTINANAITISLARSFAASAALLTMKMSENDTKFILKSFYDSIDEGVFKIKKGLEEDSSKN